MDASSIITQVSKDEEQLSSLTNSEKGINQNGKKPRKSIFRSLFCCCATNIEPPNTGSNGTCVPDDAPTFGQLPQSTAILSRNLLPPLGHRDIHKKCMVIDLDETLVHSSFKPISNADFIVPVEIDGTVHQVYVLKRPYVDDFLQKMGELYECILFTASLAKYADPVANLLDKWNVFRSRLFRESCVFHRGNYVKDLSRLGRDLHKVVIMDNSPASYIFHPDNAVPVSSWFDDMTDSELIDLVPFLETLSKVDNVYTVLKNCNNPLHGPPAGSAPAPILAGPQMILPPVPPPSVNGQLSPITQVPSPNYNPSSVISNQEPAMASNIMSSNGSSNLNHNENRQSES